MEKIARLHLDFLHQIECKTTHSKKNCPFRRKYLAQSHSHLTTEWHQRVCRTLKASSQDLQLISCPHLQIIGLKAYPADDRIEEVEVLGIFASLGECCWLFLAACFNLSLQQETVFSLGKKKGWQGKEEDEITAGELLWLSVHRAQWLKVNLEFCTLSDCPGIFSHQTSGCVPSRLEWKLLFEFASCCLEFQLQVVSWFKSFCLKCLLMSRRAYIHTRKWI